MENLENKNKIVLDKLTTGVDKLTNGVKNMHTKFKILLQKVTVMEEKMSRMDKENVVTVDSEMKSCEDMNKQFKHLDDRITVNKEIIDSIKSSHENTKATLSNKSENSTQSLKKCRYYNVGYCRSKFSCHFYYSKNLCQSDE